MIRRILLGLAFLAIPALAHAQQYGQAYVNIFGNDSAAANAPCAMGLPNTTATCHLGAVAGALTGAFTPAPTGQSQYGLTPTAGFASDGVTAITGYSACSILKPAAGNLFWVGGQVSAASYAQIYDSATIPVDGTLTWKSGGGTLVESIFLPAAGNWVRTYGGGIYPAVFAAGITVCISSTAGVVKTAIAAGTNQIQGAVQ